MQIEETYISDLKVITPKIFYDERGYFFESFNQNNFKAIGIDVEFVQN